jgi:hypothetical protein
MPEPLSTGLSMDLMETNELIHKQWHSILGKNRLCFNSSQLSLMFHLASHIWQEDSNSVSLSLFQVFIIIKLLPSGFLFILLIDTKDREKFVLLKCWLPFTT